MSVYRDLPLHQNELIITCLSRPDNTPGKYNESFEKKPTRAEVVEWLMKLDVKVQKNEQRRKNQYNRVFTGDIMCCLATLSIDQKYLQVPDLIKDIVFELRKAKYKWYEDPILRAEFFSDKDGKWNPHIHILNKRGLTNGVAPSVIKQALTKKFKNQKFQIYNVHACARPLIAGEDYINGIKKTEKQENVKKDAEYRQQHNIQDIYELKENDY